jgi:hypothetical protein
MKPLGRQIEYYKCLSCGNMWNITWDTTNICQTCKGQNSIHCSDFYYDVENTDDFYTKITENNDLFEL